MTQAILANRLQEKQFNIASHYDIMEQLDRDVHEDTKLSRSEVFTAINLIHKVPNSLFLPCFGTGRHIPSLVELGVKRIVGVDMSPKCVSKAKKLFGSLPGVELFVGDLRAWKTDEKFDAAILLGNSFADCIDPEILFQVTQGMTAPLRNGGLFLMDYIGQNYLSRCRLREPSVWDAELFGCPVIDTRTPRYNALENVMTISVEAKKRQKPTQIVWNGYYQKLILSDEQVQKHFAEAGVSINNLGKADKLNTNYYKNHVGSLGMIGQSNWWVGKKTKEVVI